MKRAVLTGLAVLALASPAILLAEPQIIPPTSLAERFGDLVAETAEKAVAPGKSASDKAIDDLSGKPSGPTGLKEDARQALRDALHDKVTDAIGFYRDFKPLSPGDKGLNVDKPAGGPKVPSKCAATSGCADCFAKAQGDVQHLRYALEKLRAIGVWTDAFTKKSLAFGDDISSVHGVAGIAWHEERKKIEASYQQFGVAYDNKYQELIGDLEGALRNVGQCEARYFGTNDWYDRFGYIYYSFMADRYRR